MMPHVNTESSKFSLTSTKVLDLVEFYVNLITLSAAEKIFEQSSNPKEFVDKARQYFSLTQQKKFIAENFKFNEEYVEIDAFLEKHYDLLSNDSLIRSKVKEMSEK